MGNKKIQLDIQGMHCASCVAHIKGDLEKKSGVKDIDNAYRQAAQWLEKKI